MIIEAGTIIVIELDIHVLAKESIIVKFFKMRKRQKHENTK